MTQRFLDVTLAELTTTAFIYHPYSITYFDHRLPTYQAISILINLWKTYEKKLIGNNIYVRMQINAQNSGWVKTVT